MQSVEEAFNFIVNLTNNISLNMVQNEQLRQAQVKLHDAIEAYAALKTNNQTQAQHDTAAKVGKA